eukprot:3596725-Rhodomonas_salina.2
MAKHGETRSEIENTQKQLPVHQARKELLFHIKRHDTLVLVGETGSGKTTQVPQFLLQAGYGKLGTIAVTQPRRVAATTVASRVASEMQVELGKEVGYSVRFDDKTSPRTKIKFMTDGMMVSAIRDIFVVLRRNLAVPNKHFLFVCCVAPQNPSWGLTAAFIFIHTSLDVLFGRSES